MDNVYLFQTTLTQNYHSPTGGYVKAVESAQRLNADKSKPPHLI